MNGYECKYCGSTFYTRTSRDAHENECSENPANQEN